MNNPTPITETYQERIKRQRVERMQQREEAAVRRKKERRLEILAGFGIAVALVVVIAAIIVASGVLTMLAWNIGVVGLVAATGGSISKISLGVAICVNLAIGVLGRIFRPAQINASK